MSIKLSNHQNSTTSICQYFKITEFWFTVASWEKILDIEPWHEISNNVVCATSKASDQPAHTHSLIRAFASRLNILRVLSYWLNIIWSF